MKRVVVPTKKILGATALFFELKLFFIFQRCHIHMLLVQAIKV